MMRLVLSCLLLLLCSFQPAASVGPNHPANSKPLKENGRIELLGGSSDTEGNVFVESTDGIFYPVCDDHWGEEEAKVVCRQLGYSYKNYTINSKFGLVIYSFAMDDVGCTGSESTLQSCKSNSIEDCSSHEAAGVICTSEQEPTPSPTCSCGIANSNRIVNGLPTEKNEFPWQVQIMRSNVHNCGGTIISTRDILTAAHCVYGDTSDIQIVVKEHNRYIYDGEENLAVQKIMIHENYIRAKNFIDYDYAIIHLSSRLSFSSSIRPACLPTTTSVSYYENKAAIATGWGKIGHFEQSSSILQLVELTTISNSECCQPGSGWTCHLISPRFICTTNGGNGKGVCNGDSGGPLVVKESNGYYTVVGVSSFVNYCGKSSVFARVTDQLSWIKSNMIDQSCI